MREQNQLLAATQDTREPGAGDFTGPGCAGTSCVWREGVGERRTAEPLEEREQGLPQEGQRWGAEQEPHALGPLYHHELWPRSGSVPCRGNINQVDQMAVCCAHAHALLPTILGAAPAYFVQMVENNNKKGKLFCF